jgi:hypothetical protein
MPKVTTANNPTVGRLIVPNGVSNPALTNQTKLQHRLTPKKCVNGHTNPCSAKKCSTCGVAVLSMSRNAVLARQRRAAKKASAKAKKAPPAPKPAPKKPSFTAVQLQRIGVVAGASVLYKGSTKIVPRTVKKITDRGVDFTDMYEGRGFILFPELFKIIRAKAVFFKDEHGNMTEMDESICYGILEAYCYKKQTTYTYGQHSYTLDWTGQDKGEQTNTSTGVKRAIKLVPIKKKVVPNILGSEYPVVDEKTLPSEFQKHLKRLSCKTKKVYHLEPKIKGDRLLNVIQQIQRERGMPSDTTVLSHGCPMDALDAIVTKGTGFQNVGTSNGKAYGHGLYLTSNINYAAGYTAANSHGQRVVLMCNVLVGGKESTGSSTTSLSSSSVRSGGSSGHIYMKPWVTLGTDVNIAYAVEFTN